MKWGMLGSKLFGAKVAVVKAAVITTSVVTLEVGVFTAYKITHESPRLAQGLPSVDSPETSPENMTTVDSFSPSPLTPIPPASDIAPSLPINNSASDKSSVDIPIDKPSDDTETNQSSDTMDLDRDNSSPDVIGDSDLPKSDIRVPELPSARSNHQPPP